MHHIRRLAGALLCSLTLALGLGASAQAHCSWALFPTIDPFPTGNQLNGVAGTGPADVWETGNSYGPSASYGYVLHWNGSAWASYAQSGASGNGGQLSGVVAPASGDVWAAGARYNAAGYAQPQAFLEHWTGSAFSPVSAPAAPQAFSYLYGMTALGSTDIWAVGGSQPASGTEVSYVIHYDGGAWTVSPSQNVNGMSTNLDAIAGSASDDVWAVGDAYGNPSSIYAPLAEHWNGSAWSIVPTPGRSGQSGRFNAVTAISRNDAWAVGQTVNGSAFVPLVEHWDGKSWRIVQSPDPHAGSVFLEGITAVGPREVWAVGEIGVGPKKVATLAMRWDGRRWTIVPSANVRKRPASLLNAVAQIPSGGLWAVGGDASAKAVIDTVTERLDCQKTAHASHR